MSSWLCALLLVQVVGIPIDPNEASWWRVHEAVARDVAQRGIAAVAAAETGEAQDAAAWMRRLQVALRAGYRDQAAQAIDRLAPLASRQQMVDASAFLGQREEWDLLRRVYEKDMSGISFGGRDFVEEWAKNGDPEEIDRWLAAREKADLETWWMIRLEFRARQGNAQALIDELAAAVRRDPTEIEAAVRYAKAADSQKLDVEWVARVVRPKFISQCYRLAEKLRLRSKEAAVRLFERSEDLPFAREDTAYLDAVGLNRVGGPSDELILRGMIRRSMAECLLDLGQADRAQRLLEKTAKAEGTGRVPWSPHFAGQVQHASGGRFVQESIEKRKKKEGHTSRYWVERGEYYEGRKEHKKALASFEKAVELAQLGEHPTWREEKERGNALGELWRYKWNSSRYQPQVWAEAIPVFLKEFDSVPKGSGYAHYMVNHLESATERAGHGWRGRIFHPGDERWWAHLAARPGQPLDGRLLKMMLESVPSAQRAPHWDRATELTKAAHPVRAAMLSEVMMQLGAPERAIPLLEGVFPVLDAARESLEVHQRDLLDRRDLRVRLFRASAAAHDWSRLRAAARGIRTERNAPDLLGDAALEAARAGALAEAMELWAMKAEIDAADLRLLDELATAGLRERLVAFYLEMSRSAPESSVPSIALARLGLPAKAASTP